MPFQLHLDELQVRARTLFGIRRRSALSRRIAAVPTWLVLSLAQLVGAALVTVHVVGGWLPVYAFSVTAALLMAPHVFSSRWRAAAALVAVAWPFLFLVVYFQTFFLPVEWMSLAMMGLLEALVVVLLYGARTCWQSSSSRAWLLARRGRTCACGRSRREAT